MLYKHNVKLKNLVYKNREYLWSSLHLDKLKLTDSISEKESEKSIQKDTNDIFVEVLEKINAVFNVTGFAIYIKISGMIIIKNYIHNRLNLRIMLNDEFNIGESASFSSVYNNGINLGFHGTLSNQYENSSFNVKFVCILNIFIQNLGAN